MPELFDLDNAFDDLVQDVATRTRPPGAERVAVAANRRRTTRLAAAALVLVVGGAGVAFWPHDGGSSRLDPAGGVPAPQQLTPAVMDRVTAGWVSGWAVPTDPAQALRLLRTAAGGKCAHSLLYATGMAEDEYGSGPSGGSLLTSGRSLTSIQGGGTTSDHDNRRLLQGGSLSRTCRNVHQSAPNDHTGLVTATASDSRGQTVLAAARWHDRFALVSVSSPSRGGSARVQRALGTALLAAIQERSTVAVTSPAWDNLRAALQTSAAQSGASGEAPGDHRQKRDRGHRPGHVTTQR